MTTCEKETQNGETTGAMGSVDRGQSFLRRDVKKIHITDEMRAKSRATRLAALAAASVSICGRRIDLTGKPDYRKNFLRRLASVGVSPTKAIRLMCFQCSGYSTEEQGKCVNRDCPLHVMQWNRARRGDDTAREKE